MAERERKWLDLSETDALINRVRASLGMRPFDAEDAHQFYAGRNAAFAELDEYLADAQSRAVADVAANFRANFPALVRWRDRVLATPRRVKAADVAAAYELLALECTLAGAHDLAERARERARRALGVVVQRTPEAKSA